MKERNETKSKKGETMKKLFKVLKKNMASPFQDFFYEFGKPYHCDNFDADPEHDCSGGFYATDIEGVLYSWNTNGKIIVECEVWGREVEIDLCKRRYENIKLIRKLPKTEILELAKAREKKCGYLLSKCIYPTFPLRRKKRITQKDIDNLKKWNSVWVSVGGSVGGSVWDSVRNSIWAYCGSIFPGIRKWKYIDHKEGEYPFQSCVELWESGLVPSYDGRVWRLHGEGGSILYTMESQK